MSVTQLQNIFFLKGKNSLRGYEASMTSDKPESNYATFYNKNNAWSHDEKFYQKSLSSYPKGESEYLSGTNKQK